MTLLIYGIGVTTVRVDSHKDNQTGARAIRRRLHRFSYSAAMSDMILHNALSAAILSALGDPSKRRLKAGHGVNTMLANNELSVATDAIRILILSNSTLTTLGLREALTGFPDIQIVAVCTTVEGAMSELETTKPNMTVLDLQDTAQRGEALAVISAAGSSTIGIIFLDSSPSDFQLVSILRESAFGICADVVSQSSLISTIRSVHRGYSLLDKNVSSQLSELLVQCNWSNDSNNASKKAINNLTERETEVLRLIATGLTNPQIAKRLIISQATAKAHVRSILSKLGVPDRTTAAVEAARLGMLQAVRMS